ncbi:MAG: hypothetical protein ACKOKC_09455, partial [Chthoniobacterales bacterium]
MGILPMNPRHHRQDADATNFSVTRERPTITTSGGGDAAATTPVASPSPATFRMTPSDINPSAEEFARLAATHRVVPVWTELISDAET